MLIVARVQIQNYSLAPVPELCIFFQSAYTEYKKKLPKSTCPGPLGNGVCRTLVAQKAFKKVLI